ncbi:TPA: sugar transferase [Enterococcus faecium]|uniref:sugar transferase n=1 Tax=Enterococcus TaxID=1350 RepID=UPI00064C83F8|nr:sugar transferase [Enterococcus faecium]
MKIVNKCRDGENKVLLPSISEVPHSLIWLDKEKVEKRYIYLFFKRIIDIVGSIIGLILLSPLMFYVAYCIRKEEPESPIFFRQIRVGKNGKIFKMYKFRSMCIDAEEKLKELIDQNEIEGAMFKIKEDPRVTKIGKVIRAKSIDELPQLLNVLKGDMSLIGPRPPLEREVAEYTKYDLQRLYVRPGCSGLWQVSGRNDVSFHKMVELDLKYISNQCLSNDIKLIIKTIRVVIKPNGAY